MFGPVVDPILYKATFLYLPTYTYLATSYRHHQNITTYSIVYYSAIERDPTNLVLQAN